MLPAIIEIHQALVRSGYSEEEADALAARFMEEEARDYIQFIDSFFDLDTVCEPKLIN